MTSEGECNYVINQTTNEYFAFKNETDKLDKLSRLQDFSEEAKKLYEALKVTNPEVKLDECGERYWSFDDQIVTVNNIAEKDLRKFELV